VEKGAGLFLGAEAHDAFENAGTNVLANGMGFLSPILSLVKLTHRSEDAP